MQFKQAIIYFMSGTGNTFRVAQWVKDFFESKATNVTLSTIEKVKTPENKLNHSDHLIALLMPTHGFTAPWLIIRFVFRLPRVKNVRAIVLATRGGLKFRNVFTPGLEGTANYLIALILWFKGYKVKGVIGIDMPSNWTSLHSALSEKKIKSIIERAKPKVENFLCKINDGKKYWFTSGNIVEFLFGIALLPVSILYLLFGRFFLAKLFYANHRCTGCRICAKNCIVNAIKMKGKKMTYPFWRYNCESCMRCMSFCPEKAVEAGHSWGVILYIIVSGVLGTQVLSWFTDKILEFFNVEFLTISKIIELGYFYLSLFLSYYVFHYIIRLSIINKLFTYTTFTYYYRRYREPDVKLSELKRE